MVELAQHIRGVLDHIPAGLKGEHIKLVEELKHAAETGRKIIIFADTDPDGASAHGLADIVRHLGARDVEVHHVGRSSVQFTEPATYVVYDISVTQDHLKDAHPDARVINIDHHDLAPRGGFPTHPWLIIANPFYTDRPREVLTREENNRLYALNPSVQLLHISRLAGHETDKIAILSAVGAVGDRAHQYSEPVHKFVEGEAKRFGLNLGDLTKIADVFELAERFPDDVSTDYIIQKYLGGVMRGNPSAVLMDKRIKRLTDEWEKVLARYMQKVQKGDYLTRDVKINGRTVRLVVLHVDPKDEKRIQKIKSAVGSALLDRFKNSAESVVIAAGQWEPGEIINYRIGVNPAGQDVGLHAGEIANALASQFNLPGGGHAAVAGAKIPYNEKERILEHLEKVVRNLLGSKGLS